MIEFIGPACIASIGIALAIKGHQQPLTYMALGFMTLLAVLSTVAA